MNIILVENTWLKREVSDHGWGNGYVALPKGHILYGMGYDEIHDKFDINVSGGLTFADHFEALSEITQSKYPELSGHWVIGFDTCHYNDNLSKWPQESVKIEAENLLKQVCQLIEPVEKNTGIKMLLGKTLKAIKVSDSKDEILFTTNDDKAFKMYHSQDCCESVCVDDIIGDLDDLIGVPIMKAEEVENYKENPPNITEKDYQDSFTWTFYHLATIKGYVTIRWYGESNGYYSESVSFEKI